MSDFVEESFIVISPRYQHKLSCIFHRKRSPYIDDQNREHVVIICHGYMSHKNALFLPQLSRDISHTVAHQFHSVRFDFHGCGESTGREQWNYGGYEDEAKDDLRCVVEHLRSTSKKYFIRALIGHSRAATTVLVYSLLYDDIPIVVNIAGRYRLKLGIVERFSKKQLDQLEKDGSFMIFTHDNGNFRITKEAIERRKNLDLSQIKNIRQARVLNIWGDQDNIMPRDEIYLFHEQLKDTKRTEMTIVANADHCFTGKEGELINIIQQWIYQPIE